MNLSSITVLCKIRCVPLVLLHDYSSIHPHNCAIDPIGYSQAVAMDGKQYRFMSFDNINDFILILFSLLCRN